MRKVIMGTLTSCAHLLTLRMMKSTPSILHLGLRWICPTPFLWRESCLATIRSLRGLCSLIESSIDIFFFWVRKTHISLVNCQEWVLQGESQIMSRDDKNWSGVPNLDKVGFTWSWKQMGWVGFKNPTSSRFNVGVGISLTLLVPDPLHILVLYNFKKP